MKKLAILGASLLLMAFNVRAENCVIDVGVGDNMSFVPSSLEVSASKCSSVTIKLSHTGKLDRAVMGHNWVLTNTADAQAVAQAGWGAGLDNQYLPPGDSRIIAGSDIIGGGQDASVTFDMAGLSEGGDYTFFCSFVGHFAIMKGKFTVTA